MNSALRQLGRWVVWVIVLAVLYEIVEDSPVSDELVAGSVIAVLAGLVAIRLYAVCQTRYAADWLELRHLSGVPLTVARDTVTVGAAILRSLFDPDALKGSVERFAFDFGDEHNPHDATRRALVTFGICLGPNSVVCMMDKGELMLHRLTGSASDQRKDPRWPI